jgi:hypothetical protein
VPTTGLQKNFQGTQSKHKYRDKNVRKIQAAEIKFFSSSMSVLSQTNYKKKKWNEVNAYLVNERTILQKKLLLYLKRMGK